MEEKYGMLTPIRPTEQRYANDVVWEFKCDCGRTVYRSLSAVKRNVKLGYMVSCGKHVTENKSNKSKKNIKAITENGGNVSLLKKEEAYANNKLGVKGVSYDSKRKKYVAQIRYKKKGYKIGRYDTVEEAKQAYDEKREELLRLDGE